jgi:hypothetical protein
MRDSRSAASASVKSYPSSVVSRAISAASGVRAGRIVTAFTAGCRRGKGRRADPGPRTGVPLTARGPSCFLSSTPCNDRRRSRDTAATCPRPIVSRRGRQAASPATSRSSRPAASCTPRSAPDQREDNYDQLDERTDWPPGMMWFVYVYRPTLSRRLCGGTS